MLARVGLTAVVLGISAALVQTTPTRTAAADVERVVPGLRRTLKNPMFTVQFDVLSRCNSRKQHAARLRLPAGQQKAATRRRWRVTAALPGQRHRAHRHTGPGSRNSHAVGAISFLQPGDWRLRFALRISDIDQASVETTVPVKA